MANTRARAARRRSPAEQKRAGVPARAAIPIRASAGFPPGLFRPQNAQPADKVFLEGEGRFQPVLVPGIGGRRREHPGPRWLAVNPHISGGSGQQAREHGQQRGLPGAVRSAEMGNLSSLQFKGKPGKHPVPGTVAGKFLGRNSIIPGILPCAGAERKGEKQDGYQDRQGERRNAPHPDTRP